MTVRVWDLNGFCVEKTELPAHVVVREIMVPFELLLY